MTEEQLTFVSMRVTDCPQPVPGGTRERCYKCGAEVWVSPASRPLFQMVGRAACNQCHPPEDLPLGQVELEASLGPAGQVVCRLCRARVTGRLFSAREHLATHTARATKLTGRQIWAYFRKAE